MYSYYDYSLFRTKDDIAASTTEEKLSQNKDEEALEAVVDDVVDDEEEEDKCSLSVITLRGAVETFFAKKFFERYVVGAKSMK